MYGQELKSDDESCLLPWFKVFKVVPSSEAMRVRLNLKTTARQAHEASGREPITGRYVAHGPLSVVESIPA